jgi:hypothetical protein
MVITRWEVNLRPRIVIPSLSPSNTHIETFGVYGGREITDMGWLMFQSEVRLRVTPNALKMYGPGGKTAGTTPPRYAMRVTPIDLRFKEVRYGWA